MLLKRNRANDYQIKTKTICPIIRIDDQIIKRVDHTKSLGLTIDAQLSWGRHVEEICKKVSSAIRGTQRQFSKNICSEDDLRSRIFGTFVVKFLACLPLLGFRTSTKWYNYPFLTDFYPKKGHLEFSGAFSWLKFSKR